MVVTPTPRSEVFHLNGLYKQSCVFPMVSTTAKIQQELGTSSKATSYSGALPCSLAGINNSSSEVSPFSRF